MIGETCEENDDQTALGEASLREPKRSFSRIYDYTINVGNRRLK